MASPLRTLPRHLAVRPLWLAAAVGALAAWPLGDDTTGLWRIGALLGAVATPARDVDPDDADTTPRALSTVGLLLLLGLAVAQRLDEPAFALLAAMATTWGVLHTWRRGPPAPPETATPVALFPMLAALAVVATVAVLPIPRGVVVALLLASGAAALLHRPQAHGPASIVDAVLASPARLLVASFTAIAVVGWFVLLLPMASTAPGSIRSLDALFTAVSATCVTGLIVLDTPTDFTWFGQAAILVLIQLGGLGIMTFAAAGAVFLGRRLGVREEALAASLVGGAAVRRDLETALGTVLRVTFWTEGLGAAVLTPLFLLDGDGLGQALWRAVFTSVSAFCNAGFALQTESLVPYQHSPAVLLTVSAIIAVGGLGPLVVVATPILRRGRGTLHAKLVVATTLALLVVPAALFLALEWNGTLGGMNVGDKLVNAWFQSVTLRTAGFNSIDFGALHPATWTVSIVCMFIGGSPGSTAGGAKTTTLAVMVLAVVAAVRGRAEASVFGRRIPHRTVYEATAITTVGVLSAAGALVAMQVTQAVPTDRALFEVVSALGTVGLTMGATGALDDVGKLLIIACMFAGRVGPLTLFIFLVGRARPGRRYPLEGVQVG